MSNVNKNPQTLKSWHLLIIGVVGWIVGALIGGAIGDLIVIFLGHLMILFAIVAFIRERIHASKANRKD